MARRPRWGHRLATTSRRHPPEVCIQDSFRLQENGAQAAKGVQTLHTERWPKLATCRRHHQSYACGRLQHRSRVNDLHFVSTWTIRDGSRGHAARRTDLASNCVSQLLQLHLRTFVVPKTVTIICDVGFYVRQMLTSTLANMLPQSNLQCCLHQGPSQALQACRCKFLAAQTLSTCNLDPASCPRRQRRCAPASDGGSGRLASGTGNFMFLVLDHESIYLCVQSCN
jgi:hypothetical protein